MLTQHKFCNTSILLFKCFAHFIRLLLSQPLANICLSFFEKKFCIHILAQSLTDCAGPSGFLTLTSVCEILYILWSGECVCGFSCILSWESLKRNVLTEQNQAEMYPWQISCLKKNLCALQDEKNNEEDEKKTMTFVTLIIVHRHTPLIVTVFFARLISK